MDFDYFLSIVESNQYFVTFKKHFLDNKEKKLLHNKRFGTHIFPIHLSGKELNEDEKKHDSEMINKMFELFEESTLLLASCWTLTKEENYLMWKSYTTKIGIRIETTIDNFVCALETTDYDIVCGNICYEGFHYPSIVENSWFVKDSHYASENEFRFYFRPKDGITNMYKENVDKKKGKTFNVDYKKLINKVVLSPFIQEKAAETIGNIIKETYKLSYELSKITVN